MCENNGEPQPAVDIFTAHITLAVNEARRLVDTHLVEGEEGHLFPYSPGDNRRISLDSPQNVKNAATLLIALTQAVQQRDGDDVDGSWGSAFMAGYFSHEVLLSAGKKVPSHEVMMSYEKSSDGRRKGGQNSAKLIDSQWQEVMKAMREKTESGFTASESARQISAQLLTKQFFQEVSKDITAGTISKRWTNRGIA